MPKIYADSVQEGSSTWVRRTTETMAGFNRASTVPRGFGILAAAWLRGPRRD